MEPKPLRWNSFQCKIPTVPMQNTVCSYAKYRRFQCKIATIPMQNTDDSNAKYRRFQCKIATVPMQNTDGSKFQCKIPTGGIVELPNMHYPSPTTPHQQQTPHLLFNSCRVKTGRGSLINRKVRQQRSNSICWLTNTSHRMLHSCARPYAHIITDQIKTRS